ncbi:MAG: Rpn family recombination-promoting nuclease/putative transposase [Muribaculaceae bacterium]|nr:Rpn family recombination-promoting nuclease/putative transposase [Muribaculaceae bacterium]
MKDFISPLSDFGFYNLYGTERGKENLIELLNSILHERLGYESIVDLKLNPTENKGLNPDRKTTRYDVHCITEKGHRIIVEMQNNWHQNFDNRIFYYGVEAISRQDSRLDSNKVWDFSIDPVVTIAICNFHNRKSPDRAVNFYTFREEETNERYGNQLSLVFLHLPAFPDIEEECETFLEKIIYSMKNMESIQTMEKIPFSTGEGDFFSRIAERSRYSALDEDERLAYDRWLKHENDRLLELEYARRDAIEKGLAEGRAEGITEGKWEIAKSMAKDGLSLEKISQYTCIPIEELKTKLN